MNDQTETLEKPESEADDDYALKNQVVNAAIDAAETGDEAGLREEFPETVFIEMAAARDHLDRSKIGEDDEIIAMTAYLLRLGTDITKTASSE